MGRRQWVAVVAAVAVAGAAHTVEAAKSSICTEADKCYVNGSTSRSCNRNKKTCQPCLAELDDDDDSFWSSVTSVFSSTEYACYSYEDDGECPKNTYDCNAASSDGSSGSDSASASDSGSESESESESDSGSGSSSKKGHKGSKSSSSSSSGSGSSSSSNSSSASGSSSTNTTVATSTPTLTPTPTETVTTSPQAETSGSSTTATEQDDSSGGTSTGLIIGIVAAVVVVVAAAIGFVVWKKRRDEEEDSDDEDNRRFDPPKATYAQPAPMPTATTNFSSQNYPYQGNTRVPAPQVPITQVTSPVAGATVNYAIPPSPEGQGVNASAAAGGGASGAAARQGSYHFSDRSSDDEQDVWGNQVGNYREKRTHSNVSVEF